PPKPRRARHGAAVGEPRRPRAARLRLRHAAGERARRAARVRAMRRIAVFLLAAFVFGVAIAAIKGQASGARDAFGNLSAVWVVVPFLAGTRYRRIWQAIAVGTATTMVAFFGFYLAEAAILDLGTHS